MSYESNVANYFCSHWVSRSGGNRQLTNLRTPTDCQFNHPLDYSRNVPNVLSWLASSPFECRGADFPIGFLTSEESEAFRIIKFNRISVAIC